MKIHRLSSYVLVVAAALIALPSYAAMQNSPQPMQLYSANARLMQSLNSNTARMGQQVVAELTSNARTRRNSIVLPKGTLLKGKVEQVQRADSNDGTRLSIVFNWAVLKDGRVLPIKATLLGAYRPSSDYSIGSASSYLPIQPRMIPDDDSFLQKSGTLKHISMESSVKSSVSAVFASRRHNIDLNRGTRLQVALAPQGSAFTRNGA